MSDQFDHNVRSRIYSLESDVPDHLWDAVDQQLRPERDRRWWFLLLIPVLTGLYLGYSASQNSSGREINVKAENETLTQPAIASTTDLVISNSVDSNVLNDQAISAKSMQVQTPSRSTEQIESKIRLKSSVLNQERVAAQDLKQAFIDQNIQSNIPVEAESTEQKNASLLYPGPNSIRDGLSLLPNIKQLQFYPEIILKDPKIDVCPSFSSRLSIKPFTEFSFSGGLPQRFIEQKEPELLDYKSLREKTEKARSSFSLTGLVGINIGERFEIKTGLSATRIYEVFDYIDESASRTETKIITDTIEINGQIIIRTDTSIVTEYGQRIKLSQNRYTTLDLPLLAAYKFEIQGHQFFLQAGVIYNLALWTKGDILSSDEEIVSIDSSTPSTSSIFRRHSGLDLTASLGYELELSEGNQLRIFGSLRQGMGNLTTTQYPLSQRYKHLHMGVSWKHQF